MIQEYVWLVDFDPTQKRMFGKLPSGKYPYLFALYEDAEAFCASKGAEKVEDFTQSPYCYYKPKPKHTYFFHKDEWWYFSIVKKLIDMGSMGKEPEYKTPYVLKIVDGKELVLWSSKGGGATVHKTITLNRNGTVSFKFVDGVKRFDLKPEDLSVDNNGVLQTWEEYRKTQ